MLSWDLAQGVCKAIYIKTSSYVYQAANDLQSQKLKT